MKSIIMEVRYQFKIQLRDKLGIFWLAIFPIILFTFFYLAFQGISPADSNFGDIGVLIEEDNNINKALDRVDFVYRELVSDKAEGLKKLEKEEYTGYIDKDKNIYIKDKGRKETILKEIVDKYYQNLMLGEDIINLKIEDNYVSRDKSINDINSYSIMYYSLIAYILSFGMNKSLSIGIDAQANLSSLGARLTISPMKKSHYVIAGMISIFILGIISNIGLYIYIEYILKLKLITNLKYTILTMLIGNLLGMSFGLLVGVSNNFDNSQKNLMVTGFPLVLSFLSGMQGPNIKRFVAEKAPIINKLNPYSLMTELLYKVNALGITSDFMEVWIKLIGICLALLFISVIYLRRKKYDSI